MRAANGSDAPVVVVSDDELAVLARGVRIIALRMLSDPDTAQDVVQETLTRALQALAAGRLRDRTMLGAFVRSIARHVVTDELRRRGRFVVPGDAFPEPETGDDDALQTLVHAEEHAAVRDAVAALSPTDQEIIQLSFVHGLTPGEVARRLHEPAERIRKRKSRALERLREIYLEARARHESGSTPTLPSVAKTQIRAAGGNG